MRQIVVHMLKVMSLFMLLWLVSIPNKTSDNIVFNAAATNYLHNIVIVVGLRMRINSTGLILSAMLVVVVSDHECVYMCVRERESMRVGM